jgi:hypothetical protein
MSAIRLTVAPTQTLGQQTQKWTIFLKNEIESS